MALPLLKAKAFSDYTQLQTGESGLEYPADLSFGQLHLSKWRLPADYEYLDQWVGVGDAHDILYAAHDLGSYQDADDVIVNCDQPPCTQRQPGQPTPHSQPHATDLLLINTAYHLTGKVIVVSLREQTLRAYDNGQMVWWSYVTTGAYRPTEQLPSWPGLHYAMYKLYHTEFTSPDPPGSPDYYAPTPINYAIAYAPNGYFLHDAWWRAEFGPDTNLPHWDPAAFSGGSHGCVNLPENNMAYLYD